MTNHKLIIGSCTSMEEIIDESVHLIFTSPPYFNAPFDYKDAFNSYEEYLEDLEKMANESFRVLKQGRIFALNIDDMLVNGEKYPITADATKIFQRAGFRFRDRIIWKKPDGYGRISRRSGVVLQNPYPMYYYPDNLLESIIIFQKGTFDYKTINYSIRKKSIIDIDIFKKEKWFFNLWEITNVLPGAKLEKGIAAFPYELPNRIVRLFSYYGETVLDPFAGSGTTMLAARRLERNSIGIEINQNLVKIIREKLGFGNKKFSNFTKDTFDVFYRKMNKNY